MMFSLYISRAFWCAPSLKCIILQHIVSQVVRFAQGQGIDIKKHGEVSAAGERSAGRREPADIN
jgi:hypothetical protein